MSLKGSQAEQNPSFPPKTSTTTFDSMRESFLSASINSLVSLVEISYHFSNLITSSHASVSQFLLRLFVSLIFFSMSKVVGDNHKRVFISKKNDKKTHIRNSLIISLCLALVLCEFSYIDNIKWTTLEREARERVTLDLMLECLWRFVMLDFVSTGFLGKLLQAIISVKIMSTIVGNEWNLATRIRFICGGILMCLGILGIRQLKDVMKYTLPAAAASESIRGSVNSNTSKRSKRNQNTYFEDKKLTEQKNLSIMNKVELPSLRLNEIYTEHQPRKVKSLGLILEQECRKNSQSSFFDNFDSPTLAKILNYLPEGVIALDLAGQVRFMNNYMKNIFQFEEKMTLEELSLSLSDFKFREASIQVNSFGIIGSSRGEFSNTLPGSSLDDTSTKLSRAQFLNKVEGITSLEDLFISCITEPEAQEAAEKYVPTFQTRYHHQHTDIWYSIEIKVHLLSESLHEKYFIILLRDTTEREHKLISLEKEKILYRDNLMASFSHELRTPLNANLGFLEQSLESTSVPDHVKNRFLKPAFDSGRLLFYMMSDILDYSLIIMHKLRLDIKPGNLIHTIEQCLNLFQLKARQKGLRLSIKTEGKLPSVFYTDHQRTAQVLTNLLNNALQFTSQGEIEVIVTRTSKSHMIIAVRDTGIGMDLNVRKRLERKLKRDSFKEKVNESSAGIGLGLEISNKLAKILSQKKDIGIGFTSQFGAGSRFFFEVENKEPENCRPLSDSSDRKGLEQFEMEENCDLVHRIKEYSSPSMKNLFSQQMSPSSQKGGPQMKVLIVDDEIFNISVIENYCHSFGITTIKAFNGREAIDKLELYSKEGSGGINLVFMDVNMPVMNGYEATLEIRKMIRKGVLDPVTIVGATAYVSNDMIEKCYEVGMSEVMNKPISKDRMVEVLKKYKLIK